MRTDRCLVFNNGKEFEAELSGVSCSLLVASSTGRPDPSNDTVLAFAPIKQARLEEMMAMATQMGVRKLQPVITDRVNEHHVKWERIRKIIIEAAEQSGRNSVPGLAAPQKFDEFLQECSVQNSECKLIFADERFAHDDRADNHCTLHSAQCTLLIGPEGGFSDAEFKALDDAGAVGLSLGKTILRAETAAVAALAQLKVLSVEC